MHRYRISFALLSLALAGGIAADARTDDSAAELLRQAERAADAGESAKAVQFAAAALEKDAELAAAYYLRGREHFRLGKVAESVADFDQFVELQPDVESRQWERGIAYYYNGQFDKGANQFELYQTYHDNDVENSVWRYLCVARTDGVKRARESILPIKNDRRVPMMQIYEMFRGNLAPDEVLKFARAGQPSKEQLNGRLFYAHLYIGLFYEADGNAALARTHNFAAEEHKIAHYMWDVAHVHAEMLRSAEDEASGQLNQGE